MKKLITMDVINNKNNITLDDAFSEVNFNDIIPIFEKIGKRIERKYSEENCLIILMSMMFAPEVFDIDNNVIRDIKKEGFCIVSDFMNGVIKEFSTKRAYEFMHDGFLKAFNEDLKEMKKSE